MNEKYLSSILINKNFQIRKIKINDSDTLDELGKLNKKKVIGFMKKFSILLK